MSSNKELTKRYKYHYTYLIINLNPNNKSKYYIGVRSTNENPFTDSYMGSSLDLKEDIKKQGLNQFTKKIINIFKTREEAMRDEQRLFRKFSCGSSPIFYNKTNNGNLFKSNFTYKSFKNKYNKLIK